MLRFPSLKPGVGDRPPALAAGRALRLAFALVLVLGAFTTVAVAQDVPPPGPAAAPPAYAPVADPATIMRNAHLIYVRKKSVYFKAQELENELRKRPEFQRWGLLITRDEAGADLIIEVGRKVFTTRFIYTVIDPRTDIVVTSGKLSSLGGTLATKIARRFIEQMQQVRQ